MFDVDNYMLEDKPAHYDIDNVRFTLDKLEKEWYE